MNYGLTAVGTAVLPGLLGVPTGAVYLVMVAAFPVMNLVVPRCVIFHAKARAGDHPAAPIRQEGGLALCDCRIVCPAAEA